MESEDDQRPLIEGGSNSNRLIDRHQEVRRIIKSCASEFLATAIFVLFGTTSVHTGDVLLVALVHGMTIAVLVHCFADISGAHINPAVTLAVYIGDYSSQKLYVALAYVFSQLTGSLAGAALTRASLWYAINPGLSNDTVYETIAGGTHQLALGLNPGQGVLIEVILTFVLCQTVLHVAVDRKIPEASMAIGLAVFIDIAIGADLTGGSMNPARSFGPAVVVSDLRLGTWVNHYVYWVGPLTGSVLAAFSYRFLFAKKKNLFSRSTTPINLSVS